MQKTAMAIREPRMVAKTILFDSHCHLDLVKDWALVTESIRYGVTTMVTNGIDTQSNKRALDISDNVNVFPALGVDPQSAMMSDGEMEENILLIRANSRRVVAIGEIGLDYREGMGEMVFNRQKEVFRKMLDLAVELRLPVSVHARKALPEVFSLLEESGADMVHLHFFDGGEEEARIAERRGYMISVPPIESSKRSRAIRQMPIELIMAESDSPVVGATPMSTEKSINIIAEAKGMAVERAAGHVVENAKKFFRIPQKRAPMMLR
ncbi:MAG: TatD family hydrolase [Candidatus Marsarchaeota archaeon]|jgi:TatD DNase family protein|nr:TatD family hydrolase [Candidatus Marsarchaeota archaeon]